jgi:hypothetical protein
LQLYDLKLTFNPTLLPGGSGTSFFCNSATRVTCGTGGGTSPTSLPIPPPLEITVNYGDGSGEATWTGTEPANVFQHMYSEPGMYNIVAKSESAYRRNREGEGEKKKERKRERERERESRHHGLYTVT